MMKATTFVNLHPITGGCRGDGLLLMTETCSSCGTECYLVGMTREEHYKATLADHKRRFRMVKRVDERSPAERNRDEMWETIKRIKPTAKLVFKDDPQKEGWGWKEKATMAIAGGWFRLASKLTGGKVDAEKFNKMTTVLFGTIMYTSSERWAKRPQAAYRTLRHELVHIRDQMKHPIWFPVSYWLALPIWFTMRAHWEYRGFTQTMITRSEEEGSVSPALVESIAKSISGSTYLFAASKRRALKRLTKIADEINNGTIPRDEFYPHPAPKK